MKRLIVGLGLVAVLLIGLAVPALGAAVESTKSASVTVRSYISATVTDYGAAGVNFGSLDPGTSNNVEVAQAPSTGAVQVAVGAESNVVCKIGVKGAGVFAAAVTSGTATGGSTTTLIDTTKNFTTAGVTTGMSVAIREGAATAATATITSITTTTNPNDTLNFAAIGNAVVAADAYRVYQYYFALSNAVWDSDNAVSGATTLTTSYAQIGTDTTPGVARSQEIWHWLSIPNGQTAATYSSTFYYKADSTL